LAALFCGAMADDAWAQTEVYSAGGANNNEAYNGASTSNPTSTQGQKGDVFCAPPHEIVDGKDITPLNWSCPTVQQPYVLPQNMTVARPGPPVQPGAANPCQPGGPGGYDFRDNAPGVPLPPGCVRPATAEAAPPGSYLQQPIAAPGSYLQPDDRPGSYLQPPIREPGSYLQPDGRPGSYLQPPASAPASAPASSIQPGDAPGSFVQTPNGVVSAAEGNLSNASNAARQDNAAMRGGAIAGDEQYRQDNGAMQGAISNGSH
jgi:hypothetical protein